MKITRTKKFIKKFEKLSYNIQSKFLERLDIFISNPFLKELENHALNGEYIGFRSINVTGNYRAIFREFPDGKYEFVEFVNIGTHSQLYK